ncbi:AMP-binding protein [Vibrio salinus]|uniref:AMP-binding protein n=1 Tax=Vibrio salinus TaxID=2899784 RepID=UPI001E4E9F11|nr:AMP-binding protein [Vibrio salinus]MCE0494926.1 AMP-binding protein [Vibrio salinus]
MSLIIDKLYQQADSEPEKVAFYASEAISGRERSVTYGELATEVRRLTRLITSHDVSCLAIELENSYEWLVSDLAALASGIACLPVPMFFTRQQKKHLFNSVRVDAIVSRRYSETIPETGHSIAELSHDVLIVSVQPESNVNALPGTSKITFTSGSTGTPKGVCLSSAHLDRVTMSLATVLPTLNEGDKHLVMLPLSTLLENITGIYVPIIVGSPSTILVGENVGLIGSSQFDTQAFCHSLEVVQPATLVLTPALLAALVGVAAHYPGYTRSLKFVAVGGAKAPVSILNQARDLGLPVYEGYGLSECASVVSVNSPVCSEIGTVGCPLPHHQVKTASDGEILVSPAGFLGYLGEPFDGEWYATGDLGEWSEEGYLNIIGRKKNLIVTSFGRNISPEWIETKAYEWPELRTLILVGEIAGKLVALIISMNPDKVTDSICKLNAVLPDYAQIHTAVIVTDDAHVRSYFTQNLRPVRNDIYSAVHEWMSGSESLKAGICIESIIQNQ